MKNAVDPDAVGIELHDLAQWVGHVRPRSFDDTVPLLQLAQGLLVFCSDELALLVARGVRERTRLLEEKEKEVLAGAVRIYRHRHQQ